MVFLFSPSADLFDTMWWHTCLISCLISCHSTTTARLTKSHHVSFSQIYVRVDSSLPFFFFFILMFLSEQVKIESICNTHIHIYIINASIVIFFLISIFFNWQHIKYKKSLAHWNKKLNKTRFLCTQPSDTIACAKGLHNKSTTSVVHIKYVLHKIPKMYDLSFLFILENKIFK